MIEGIRSIDIQYTTLIKKRETQRSPVKTPRGARRTDGKPTEEKAQAAEEFDRKVVDEWKTNTEDQKPPWPLIPQFVTMQVKVMG